MIAVKTLNAERHVAPKRKGKDKRDDTAVKLDRKVAFQAMIVAKQKGVSVAEYITELLRGPVGKDFTKAVREMGEGGES